MKYLNDEWTFAIDQIPAALKFAQQARAVITEAPTPFALTIGGRWGSGKTSMLQALQRSLDKTSEKNNASTESNLDKHGKLPDLLLTKPGESSTTPDPKGYYYTVWFNPWQYQNEPNPLIPLLHEIREQMSWLSRQYNVEAEASTALFHAGMRSLGALIDSALSFLSGRTITVGNTIQTNLAAEKERLRKETFSNKVEAQQFHKEFEKAIQQVVYPGYRTDATQNRDSEEEQLEKKRLVIFIDDLDRCGNEAAYTLLEAVRLYLSSRHCVFVFGLDRAQVETAVIKGGSYNPTEAAQYVDKMFQIHLTLPTFTQNDTKHLLNNLAQNMGWSFGVGQEEQKDQEKDDNQSEKHFFFGTQVTNALAELLPTNPRFIKNFLNGLLFQYEWLRQETDASPVDEIAFILVHYLRVMFLDIYELLAQQQRGALIDLLDVCRDRPPKNERHRYILYRMENPLIPPSPKNTESVSLSLEDEDEEAPEAQQTSTQHTPQDKEKRKSDLLEDERFRLLRAGAWRARSLGYFKEAFQNAFRKDNPEQTEYAKIERYLV